jgi:hypothetical protein
MKSFLVIFIFISIIFGAFYAVASTDAYQQKLDDKKTTEFQNLCQQNGAEMNQYYGKEICPSEFMR